MGCWKVICALYTKLGLIFNIYVGNFLMSVFLVWRCMMTLWMHQLMVQHSGWVLLKLVWAVFVIWDLLRVYLLKLSIIFWLAFASFGGIAGRACGNRSKFIKHYWIFLLRHFWWLPCLRLNLTRIPLLSDIFQT